MMRVRGWMRGAVLLVGVANLGSAFAAPPARAGLTWYRTWNEAQAVARAEGKVVLAASTRPGCSLCERFRSETAPQCSASLSQVAVGYVYDIGRPDMAQVDHAIRSRLSGAKLMPLVGFLTPDQEWVHGFWGSRSPQQLLGDIEHVRRVRSVRVAPAPPPAPVPALTAAPQPRANATVASGSAPVPTKSPPPGTPAAKAPRAASPPSTPPVPAATPGLARPRANPPPCAAGDRCPGGVCEVPTIFDGPTCGPLPVPASRRNPAAAAPTPPPASTITAADTAAAAGDWCAVRKLTRGATDPRLVALDGRARRWAQDELDRCLGHVLAGRPDSALAGLRQVKTAMVGEPAGVDAEQGIDAVETARDLQRLADPGGVLAVSLRRNKYEELKGTRWARLFEGT